MKIIQNDDEPGMRDWLGRTRMVCITSPQLKSITGESAAITLNDLNEKYLDVHLTGKSNVEIETLRPDFDSLFVILRDSSQLKFEMAEEIPSSGLLTANFVSADLRGNSFLDVGHIQIKNLKKTLDDTAAMALNGMTLEIMGKADRTGLR